MESVKKQLKNSEGSHIKKERMEKLKNREELELRRSRSRERHGSGGSEDDSGSEGGIGSRSPSMTPPPPPRSKHSNMNSQSSHKIINTNSKQGANDMNDDDIDEDMNNSGPSKVHPSDHPIVKKKKAAAAAIVKAAKVKKGKKKVIHKRKGLRYYRKKAMLMLKYYQHALEKKYRILKIKGKGIDTGSSSESSDTESETSSVSSVSSISSMISMNSKPSAILSPRNARNHHRHGSGGVSTGHSTSSAMKRRTAEYYEEDMRDIQSSRSSKRRRTEGDKPMDYYDYKRSSSSHHRSSDRYRDEYGRGGSSGGRGKIRFVPGDATEPIGEGPRIIAHVCNDSGGWGKGFVVALSKRWPEPEDAYRNLGDSAYLGQVQFVPVSNDITVANMIAQTDPRDSMPLHYGALESALRKVADYALDHGSTVHMPKIGTGLAKGDWSRIKRIVNEQLLDRGVSVVIYRFQFSNHY